MMTNLILDRVAFAMAKARLLIPSNAELARRTGISGPYLRAITGGFIPMPETRERIAKELQVKEGDLWRVVEMDDAGARVAR